VRSYRFELLARSIVKYTIRNLSSTHLTSLHRSCINRIYNSSTISANAYHVIAIYKKSKNANKIQFFRECPCINASVENVVGAKLVIDNGIISFSSPVAFSFNELSIINSGILRSDDNTVGSDASGFVCASAICGDAECDAYRHVVQWPD
jgi:hypothetical protein